MGGCGVNFMTSVTRQYANVRWSKADLLFLASALSLVEAAGFLCRTEEEVR
jgi:hypothetical protein